MRWRSRRSGAGQNDQQKPERVDRISLAIRQRRIWSAQERVRALPGFAGLEHRWCDMRGSDELDHRRADLDGRRRTAHWPEPAPLVAALRAAAAEAPAGTAFALLLAEPEAQWIEVALGDLLQATATVLSGLQQGIVILGADDRALLLDVTRDAGAPATYDTTLIGDWPVGMLA